MGGFGGVFETKGYGDSDSRGPKGWTKSYKVTLVGNIGPVEATLTLKAEDLADLEAMVPMERNVQRKISIEPVNHSLDIFHPEPTEDAGAVELQDGLLDEDQQRQLRKDRYDQQEAQEHETPEPEIST